MGCSSAALAENGEFEPAGPVWNYMMAGCPAVVGTLWDVTDRDVDRFAGGVVEGWGLVGRGTFVDDGGGKGGRGRSGRNGNGSGNGGAGEGGYGSMSLVEAVASARGRCRFRFVTAAAAVVYGIPVYVER
jgi:separase